MGEWENLPPWLQAEGTGVGTGKRRGQESGLNGFETISKFWKAQGGCICVTHAGVSCCYLAVCWEAAEYVRALA